MLGCLDFSNSKEEKDDSSVSTEERTKFYHFISKNKNKFFNKKYLKDFEAASSNYNYEMVNKFYAENIRKHLPFVHMDVALLIGQYCNSYYQEKYELLKHDFDGCVIVYLKRFFGRFNDPNISEWSITLKSKVYYFNQLARMVQVTHRLKRPELYHLMKLVKERNGCALIIESMNAILFEDEMIVNWEEPFESQFDDSSTSVEYSSYSD